MDFFGHQEAARRRTSLLIAYFVLAVLLIIVTVYAAAMLVFVYEQGGTSGRRATPTAFWNPDVFGLVAVGTLAVVVAGSLYKIAALRRGGQAVAEALGATPVASDTLDPRERRLLNVVAEMAIASGMPVPPVYVLRQEAGINAFAAGYSTSDAVVAVTRGALQTLSRDGLQGIIAHEFSHILNGDMRLNIRLMGVLHGILLIGLSGEALLRSMRRSRYLGRSRAGTRRGGGGIALFGLALFVIGYIGVFFARLIKASVSRQREFLADASAVQFTRNPDGIAGALKKIGSLAAGSALTAPNAETASHLYFCSGLAARPMRLLATHPSLAERILRIDPQWDGTYPPVHAEALDAVAEETDPARARARVVPGRSVGLGSEAETPFRLTPEESVARVGTLTPAHVAFAQDFVSELPAVVSEAAHEAYGARALAYALVMSRDETVCQSQLARLEQHADPGVLKVFRRILPAIVGLSRDAYLPLVDISLPALRSLSRRQYEGFRDNLSQLAAADLRTSPFELALLAVLRRHLDRHVFDAAPAVAGHHSLTRLARECGVLLSALAHIGHRDADAVVAAFAAGVSRLGIKNAPSLTPADETDLSAAGVALDKLVQLAPSHKRKLIAACTSTIAHDGQVTVEEGEILRAVSDSLEVPMPPFLPSWSGDLSQRNRDE